RLHQIVPLRYDFYCYCTPRPLLFTVFPYTTLFRSPVVGGHPVDAGDAVDGQEHLLRWYTRAGPCRGLMSWSHFSSSPPGPALLMSLPRQCQQLPTSQQPVAPVTAPIVPCGWHKD